MGDLGDMLAGLSVAAGVAAIFGAGALLVAPGFARWLTDTIATFFDDAEANFDEGGAPVCENCGNELEPGDMGDERGGLEVCGPCADEWDYYHRED